MRQVELKRLVPIGNSLKSSLRISTSISFHCNVQFYTLIYCYICQTCSTVQLVASQTLTSTEAQYVVLSSKMFRSHTDDKYLICTRISLSDRVLPFKQF